MNDSKTIEHAYECPTCEGEQKFFQEIPGHEDCGCHDMVNCETCDGKGHLTESQVLQTIFNAAQEHGRTAGACEHEIGDLQDVIRKCFSIMTAEQVKVIIGDDDVKELIAREL